MKRKIIIPAAGNAARFDGLIKELIPLDDLGTTGLLNTVTLAVHKLCATDIILVTNNRKKDVHLAYQKEVLAPAFPGIRFKLVEQQQFTAESRDLLDAIITGLMVSPHDEGGMLLPDTVTMFAPQADIKTGLTFGTFKTTEPKRFSIIAGDRIITKESLPDGTYHAWGVVLWSSFIGLLMQQVHAKFTHYDRLFEAIMHDIGYQTFDLEYYADIGNIQAYMEHLYDYGFTTDHGSS